MAATNRYNYTHLTTGTTVINKGKGVLLAGVMINKALTGTVTITDGGATVAIFTNGTTAPLGNMVFAGDGAISLQSLTVALSATEDITVVWQ